jgi:hypothetical protein
MSGNKFSVVMPTLWKSQKIWYLFDELEKHPLIGEVILIDNDYTIGTRLTKKYEKIVPISSKRNLYVNPAWNIGVANSIYDNICILSDDLIFDFSIFDWIPLVIDKGIIGMNAENYYLESNYDFRIEPMVNREWGWGCLMFLKKENWVDIDNRMKVAYGDDFLMRKVQGGSWMLRGLKIETRMSETSLTGEFIHQSLTVDKVIYEKIFGL